MKKATSLIIVILLLIVIRGIWISIQELKATNTQADTLSSTLSQKQKENEFLKQKLVIVRSDGYIEEQARNKLGLVHPGEKMVLVPSPIVSPHQVQGKDEQSNIQKWLKLFF